MLVGFSFRAKPGKAAELERHLNDPEGARRVAEAMGATRNTLFWQGDRMVRVLEFPDGAKPVPLSEVMRHDAGLREFLRRVGELAEPGFDVDRSETLEAFNHDAALRLVLDVRA